MGIIVWSPEATDDMDDIIGYLLAVWGEGAAIEFGDEVDRVLQIIASMPELYPLDDTGTLHQAVIVKQVTILYSVKDEYIELSRFWDNRQNPSKLKY